VILGVLLIYLNMPDVGENQCLERTGEIVVRQAITAITGNIENATLSICFIFVS
jgi:hypothetical protein